MTARRDGRPLGEVAWTFSGGGFSHICDIGGTSLSAPQWAGFAEIGAQMKGHGLGLINPAR